MGPSSIIADNLYLVGVLDTSKDLRDKHDVDGLNPDCSFVFVIDRFQLPKREEGFRNEMEASPSVRIYALQSGKQKLQVRKQDKTEAMHSDVPEHCNRLKK